jgi:hypothetical protein
MTIGVDPTNDLERVAVHEAGHVWAMADAGLDPSTVAITPALNGEARWLSGTVGSHQEVLVICSAGEVTERVFGFTNAGVGSDRDRGTAAAYVREFMVGPSVSDMEVNRLVAASRHQASTQLADRKAEIARFAETLLRNNGRLGGYEVSDALRHAQNSWPSPDFSSAGRFQLTVRRRELFEDLVRPEMTREELDKVWQQADAAARSGSPPRVPALSSRTVHSGAMFSETDRYLLITEARRAGKRSWWAT